MNLIENHTNLILEFARSVRPQRYLELGIRDGSTFTPLNTVVPHCVGVDIYDKRVNKVGDFRLMTTDEFFEKNTLTFDVVFIDADHSFDAVRKDFSNALKVLNKHGTIILHDTDPVTKQFLAPECCNDCYKILEYIDQHHPELQYITFPIGVAGLTFVKRKNDKRTADYL